MFRVQAAFVVVGFVALSAPAARAQGVAFVPGVGTFPEGAMMSATPVVSADRRYVRLTMNPQFTALNSFATLEVPGAVSGGTGGGGLPAGLAGLNGPGANGPARPAAAGLNAIPPGPIGGRSTSDSFQNALAHYSDSPSASQSAAPAPRKAKAAGPKRGSRRREIIRRRP